MIYKLGDNVIYCNKNLKGSHNFIGKIVASSTCCFTNKPIYCVEIFEIYNINNCRMYELPFEVDPFEVDYAMLGAWASNADCKHVNDIIGKYVCGWYAEENFALVDDEEDRGGLRYL